MPVENLMNNLCDIYLPVTLNNNLGYGLSGQPEIKYNKIPDFINVKCHTKFKEIEIIENKSNMQVTQQNHIDFPANSPVKKLAKVIDKDTNITYYVSIVRTLRDGRLRAQIVSRKEFL